MKSLWPVGIVGSLLAVLAVNITMIVLAGRAPLLESQPYERGIAYNAEIAALSLPKRLGWKLSIGWKATESGCVPVIALSTGEEARGGALQVSAKAIRPDSTTPDLSLHFTQRPDHLFEGSTSLADGLWLLRIEVSDGAQSGAFKQQVIAPSVEMC